MRRVSIIIPTHNRAKMLESAIKSVLGQTLRELDIIVVDDASNDRTYETVRSFKDKRIRYIRSEVHKGGAAARNLGIRESDGDCIAFLDDDDEWLPDKLQMQMDLLAKSSIQVGGVYTGHLLFDDRTGRILSVWRPQKRGNIFEDMFTANWVSTTSSLLLRRSCFDRAGLFDENLPSFQDYDMWLRISRTFHFDFIDEPLVRYRVHERKIWTNPGALIRGMEMMLTKYGEHRALRKTFSGYYISFGIGYCNSKEMTQGRRAFLKAIRLNPFDIRYYFFLLISLFGTNGFVKLRGFKDRIMTRLRTRKSSIVEIKE